MGNSRDAGAIGLFSSLLGEVQPDYPRSTSIVGFASFDGAGRRLGASHPALEAFLNSGSAPLVFTLGSLIVNSPGRFYAQGARAARALGRCVRCCWWASTPAPTSRTCSLRGGFRRRLCGAFDAVRARRRDRASRRNRHARASACAPGRPQLIVPHFADQPDNAARARRLGVARILPPWRYSAASVRRHLAQLLGDGRHLERARRIGESLSAEDGAARAARIVLDTLEEIRRN